VSRRWVGCLLLLAVTACSAHVVLEPGGAATGVAAVSGATDSGTPDDASDRCPCLCACACPGAQFVVVPSVAVSSMALSIPDLQPAPVRSLKIRERPRPDLRPPLA
jgi:hypothetical protein